MPCGSCREELGDGRSISCDLCWNWFHMTCTNLNDLPPAEEPWVCIRCHRREVLHAREIEDRRQEAENMRNLVETQTQLINTLMGNRDPHAVSLRRQTLRKLPVFSGDDITQWPTFKAVYDQTTTEGHYDDVENCGRLLDHLTLNAKALVQVKLSNPANLNEVMRCLEQNFGNPERIYDKLIQNALNARCPRDGKPESLFEFTNKVSDLVCTLEIMDMQARLVDARLIGDFKKKLSLGQQEKWIEYARDRDATDLRIFKEFLELRSQVAREMCFDETRASAPRTRGNVHMHQEYERAEPVRQIRCPICPEACHRIDECPQFEDLSIEQRWERVRAWRFCFGCLKRARHQLAQCLGAVVCGVNGCTKKHHHLLHSNQVETQQSEATPNQQWRSTSNQAGPRPPPGPSGPVAHHRANNTEQTWPEPIGVHPMFMILPVTAMANNKRVETFAFLDNGSAFTLVDSSLAQELELTGTPEEFSMICAKEQCITESNSIRTTLEVAGRDASRTFRLQDARTVEKLGLPTGSLDPAQLIRAYPHLDGLPIPEFKDAVPKILIGLNNAPLLSYNRIVECAQDAPIAVKTKLGWCIFGRRPNIQPNKGVTFHLNSEAEKDENLHDLVRSFFTTEHFGCKPILHGDKPENESRVQKIVDNTLKKIQGRYQVGLLWKQDEMQLPDSRALALKRLKFVEARMNKEPELHDWYVKEISSYVEKGYCRKLSPAELAEPSSKTFYIPFFHVVNENKTPRKIRLVFDCAAKVGGKSLNSFLLTGPNVYVSMPGVIFKAREGRICVAADIKEMFPQIKIQPTDQFAQRFLWRDGNATREPDVYVMTSMLFGSCCSPYLAQLVKNRNAKQFERQFPDAVNAILTQHFVDDYLNSHDTTDEAIRIATDIIHIHKEAGFELRNFVSNSKEVLKALPKAEQVTKEIALNWEGDEVTEKILGVHWNIGKDQFEVKLNARKIPAEIVTFQRPPTKRELLRITMSIFDPIGLLSHVLIRPKVLIQETWRSGINWDEQLPEVLFMKWKNWLRSFLELANLAIPRPYCRNMENVKEIQMHVLVDASESAFAAVVYFRLKLENHIECVLVTSKSKVAPNKVLSVPRLELQAAVLGSRLATYVRAEHRLKIDSQVFWSDSQTTLSWINCTDLQGLKPFVGVRVSEIQELTSTSEWRKVPTQLNVADDATKWSEDTSYKADDRWFQGPSFLLQPEVEWPVFVRKELPEPTEKRAPVFVVTSPAPICEVISWDKFSKYDKLVRVYAYVLKFVDKCSVKHDKSKLLKNYQQFNQDSIKAVKLEAWLIEIAEMSLVKRAQQEAFAPEFEALVQGKMLSRKSPLVPLNPVLDEMELIRASGRIRRVTNVEEASKVPAILPNQHPLTDLIIQHYHQKFAHAFHESVLAATRHKFWIIRGRQAVRRVKSKCQRCKNKRAAPQPTLMGELPLCRLDWRAKPFYHTGMDLYGPIRAVIFRKPIKCYVMLFTCMVTRAIHLELVMSLNTDDCILNLRNFLNRRGPVAHFYCDNGTNWHGAHNELVKELQNCSPAMKRANDECTVEWHFQPPAASHFGGAYERLIQSVQRAMDTVLTDRAPRLETLRAALIECENIINARPLTHVPLEVEDDDPLTPNDLLKMHPNKMPAPGEFVSQDVNLRKQWRVAQQLANEFWNKWRQLYLPELARRSKWHHAAPTIKPDDIVLIVDGNLPRNEWRKARVVRTIAGEDGIVRVAIVKHNNKEYSRPIMKLAKLDLI